MAVTAHVFPSLDTKIATKLINLTTTGTQDSLGVLLISSSSYGNYSFNSTQQTHATVSAALANTGGTVLTEASGTGYARQQLTGVTCITGGSPGPLVTTLTCANPFWTSSTISAGYAFFYDYSVSGGALASTGDASNALICYWDFGGTQASSNGTFTLQINASGLVTWTAS